MFSHVFFHLMMEFEWGPVPVRSIAIQIASIPGGESGAWEGQGNSGQLGRKHRRTAGRDGPTDIGAKSGADFAWFWLCGKKPKWHSVENFVDLQESEMKKEFETFNLKASKDINLLHFFEISWRGKAHAAQAGKFGRTPRKRTERWLKRPAIWTAWSITLPTTFKLSCKARRKPPGVKPVWNVCETCAAKEQTISQMGKTMENSMIQYEQTFFFELLKIYRTARLTQEIKDIQTEIQGERQKREVLESETRDQKAWSSKLKTVCPDHRKCWSLQ